MDVLLPEFCLVLLVGPSGCGKSTFARQHFKPSEVVSSDACRAMVSDDENNQAATRDAFGLLHFIVEKRLAAGHFTVVDATNIQPAARKPLIALAREYHAPLVALVFALPEELCFERNAERPERRLKAEAVQKQFAQFEHVRAALKKENFQRVVTFATPEQVETARVVRERLPNNRRQDAGPFDVIGDVHGCATELEELLAKLGYTYRENRQPGAGTYFREYSHPEGRKAVFVGDLVDRGPRILDAFQLVRAMVRAGKAYCVLGNHDEKLLRKLRGRDVQISHGLERTLAELDALPPQMQPTLSEEMIQFFADLPGHYVFDHGRLVVAHAGIKKSMIGRESKRIREFTLYGETTGEVDEYGLPVRYNWAGKYHGKAIIVYGHIAVSRPEWVNHTIDIDTGCVFGGSLTALRYPELELVSVPAKEEYTPPSKPFQEAGQP